MRQLQLMMKIYDATIMGVASNYQSPWNLLTELIQKNSPYQFKCEKYHFDTPFISPLSFKQRYFVGSRSFSRMPPSSA